MRGRVFIKLSLLAVVAMLVMATSAMAQSPADSVYHPKGEVLSVVQGGGDSGPSGTAGAGTAPTTVESGAAPAASGSLPFTGFQAGLVALAGLALVGTGFAMRRVARNES
jgi:hypothetical protein